MKPLTQTQQIEIWKAEMFAKLAKQQAEFIIAYTKTYGVPPTLTK